MQSYDNFLVLQTIIKCFGVSENDITIAKLFFKVNRCSFSTTCLACRPPSNRGRKYQIKSIHESLLSLNYLYFELILKITFKTKTIFFIKFLLKIHRKVVEMFEHFHTNE